MPKGVRSEQRTTVERGATKNENNKLQNSEAMVMAKLLEGWYVHQAQIDGLGGKAHRYSVVPTHTDFAARLCGRGTWGKYASALLQQTFTGSHCKTCEKMQHAYEREETIA